jgi:hypothetical protein
MQFPDKGSADMQFDTFSDFYAYYLTQHRNRTSRRLHVIGTGCVIAIVLSALLTLNPWLLLLARWLGMALPGPGISLSKRTGRRPSATPSGACAAIS